MEVFAFTDRLLLREIVEEDAAALFEVLSDPLVHTYLGNKYIQTMDESVEAIRFIRKQYAENGIGRWAVVEKDSNQFIGWAGLKLITEPVNEHVNYYDLGYRFKQTAWRKGYATESSIAILKYGFNQLKLKKIYAMADVENRASNAVLKKVGMALTDTFNFEGKAHNWHESSNRDAVG